MARAVDQPELTGVPNVSDSTTRSNGSEELARMTRLASARRIVNLCLFVWAAAVAFGTLKTVVAPLVVLVAVVAALFGVIRLAIALRVSSLWRFIFVVAMFVPVVNLIAMGWLSTRATKVLRAAGFSVGLFRATPASAA